MALRADALIEQSQQSSLQGQVCALEVALGNDDAQVASDNISCLEE